MKKYFILIISAGLLAIACNKEAVIVPENIEAQPATYEFTLNASMDQSEATKTAYADNQTFSWSAGDQISVLFHKDTENKFYTLTTSTGGSASATFTGTVDAGWTIGSSDDGVKWALYPASANHTYTAGETNPISFYIPGTVDFTDPSEHVSANIPMEGRGDGSNNFTFKHLSTCYKFTFTGLSAVSKVKFTIENIGNGYYLSGSSPVKLDGSEYYLQHYDGSGSKTVSYIKNVTSNTVEFYVSYRGWETFKPKITLKNMDTGDNYDFTIYQASAKSTLTASGVAWGKMVVVPSKDLSAYGVGSPLMSKFGINWASAPVSAVGATSTGHDGITAFKAAADDSYLYVFLGVDDSKLIKGYDYSNYFKLYLGEESVSTSTSWMWGTAPNTFTEEVGVGWLLRSGDAKFSTSGDPIYNDSQAVSLNGMNYYEIKLNRSAKTYLSSGTGTAHIGCLVYYQYYAWGGTQGDYYMYAPGSGSLLAVDLPDYVAP
jgi:hypothetical protein